MLADKFEAREVTIGPLLGEDCDLKANNLKFSRTGLEWTVKVGSFSCRNCLGREFPMTKVTNYQALLPTLKFGVTITEALSASIHCLANDIGKCQSISAQETKVD